MERRDFLRAAGLAVAAGAVACSPPGRRLPMLVRDPALVSGAEKWLPSLCTDCPAGCGVLARVVPPGRAVKLEGHPEHPVAGGALCARGQTALESLYHPDRITQAQKRAGNKGGGAFVTIDLAAAQGEIASRLAEVAGRNPAGIAVLAGRLSGTDRALLDRFLAALGAPPAIEAEPLRAPAWREALRRMTGHDRLPSAAIESAGTVMAFGVDLLGQGESPVRDARAIARMRARPERPGRLIAVSSRFHLTAARADEWIACAPGSEGAVALGIGHALLALGLVDPASLLAATGGFDLHEDAAGLPRPGLKQILRQYPLDKVESITGIEPATIERLARELVERRPALALGGGAAAATGSALGQMMAVLALDGLLGSFGPEGLSFAPRLPFASLGPAPAGEAACLPGFGRHLAKAEPGPIEAVLVMGGANPIYQMPELGGLLATVPLVVQVGSLMEDTALLADFLLPEAHPLERWIDDEADPAPGQALATLAAPALRPRGAARSPGDHLLGIARAMGGEVARALPFESLEAALRLRWAPLVGEGGLEAVAARGFLAGAPAAAGFATASGRFEFTPPSAQGSMPQQMMGGMEPVSSESVPHFRPPHLEGDLGQFPLLLQIIETAAAGAGAAASRPGLNELLAPLGGGPWQAWAELSPADAAREGIANGMEVAIETPHGSARFPARVVPWLAPGVVAASLGGGHATFGRFALRRGGNALALASRGDIDGAPGRAWALTRARVGKAEGG